MTKEQLTLKQQRWLESYLVSGNATDAARVAGYSLSCSSVQGAENLANPKIAAVISQRRSAMSNKTEDLQLRIINELKSIAFANLEDFTRLTEDGDRVVDFTKATREQMAALSSIQSKTRKVYTPKGEHIATEHHIKVTKDDKLRGLELLGKQIGMFKNDEVKVVVDVADRLLAARRRVQLALPRPDDDAT